MFCSGDGLPGEWDSPGERGATGGGPGGGSRAMDPGLARLEEFRSWLATQVDDEALVEDHAPVGFGDLAALERQMIDALAGMDSVLAGVDLEGLGFSGPGGDGLMAASVALESTRRRLDAVSASVLGRMDALGVTEARAGVGAKTWKANRTRSAPRAVGRELRVARTLERFDSMADALGDGVISSEHVLALAGVCNERTVDALVDQQDQIVWFAKHHRFGVYVAFLRRLVAVVDTDGAEPDCGDRDTATMDRDFDGNLRLFMELSGHNAVEAEAIINTETDRQYRAAVREHEASGITVPGMTVLRARAVMELLRRGADPNPSRSHPVPSVILPLAADRDGLPTGLHTTDGDLVDPQVAAVLLCDAYFQPVLIDSTGNPLNLGRRVRCFTPTQKQAMIVRDGGCVFPGCDQPARRCAAHHRLPWEDGGRTDIDNGALLCPRHHGLVHCDEAWVVLDLSIGELPADLAERHRRRAQSANLEPGEQVVVLRSPTGELHLAQNATDHHGPAPPRRTAA